MGMSLPQFCALVLETFAIMELYVAWNDGFDSISELIIVPTVVLADPRLLDGLTIPNMPCSQ
jgi:hypothetical protein